MSDLPELDPQRVTDSKTTAPPTYGRCVTGYSKMSGAPTPLMVKLDGKGHWRRVMCWVFSNSPTYFLPIGDEKHIMPTHLVTELSTGADD